MKVVHYYCEIALNLKSRNVNATWMSYVRSQGNMNKMEVNGNIHVYDFI